MNNTTADHAWAGGQSPERSPRRRMTRAERWGLIAAAVGVVVALLAWLFPDINSGDPPTPTRAGATTAAAPATTGTTTTGTTTTGTTTTGTTNPGDLTYLDTLAAQKGNSNLVGLPRALSGRPDYPHPVVITCATNQNDDQVREVTYPLRGRYLGFSATVRPYFADRPDTRTNVYAIAGYLERDGTVTRQEKGRQLTATMNAPAPLTASVDGAEELTIQVRCEEPDGVVVLVAPGLTR